MKMAELIKAYERLMPPVRSQWSPCASMDNDTIQGKTGGSGLWIPVRPQNLPNERSKNDFPIMLTVSLPPDARTGLMVEKSVLRRLGKKSAAQFNAYFNIVLAIQSLWNITKASGEKKVRQDSLFTNLTLSHYKNWKNSG